MCQGTESEWTGVCQGRGWEHTFQRLSGVWNRRHAEPVALLFADAELGNNRLIPFRVVLLQVIKQATAPAHHHEKSAARAVIFLVRLEMLRQLTDPLAK